MEAIRWDEHYQNDEIPWDIGGTTKALVDLYKDATLRKKRILVPGCGRGHDAHFLSLRGADVVGADYSSDALEAARATYPQSRVTWSQTDVTTMAFDEGFDLIWEYTCFCALQPKFREAYLDRVAANLNDGGQYCGMVFHSVPDPKGGPPFEIEADAFRKLLEERFEVDLFEADTERSIKPRLGKEIFFQVSKRRDA